MERQTKHEINFSRWGDHGHAVQHTSATPQGGVRARGKNCQVKMQKK